MDYPDNYCGLRLGGDSWCVYGFGWDPGYTYVTYNSADATNLRVGIEQHIEASPDVINRKFGDNHVATNSACRYTLPDVANASSPGNVQYVYGYGRWTYSFSGFCSNVYQSPGKRPRTLRRHRTRAYKAALASDQAQLGILNRARTASDRLPPTVEGGPDAQRYGWVNGDARRATRPIGFGDGDQFYVVPGGAACLVHWWLATQESGLMCNRPAAIANGYGMLFEDADTPGRVVVSGLAPDGVVAVSVQMTTGQRKVQVPVVDNVFTTELSGDAALEPAEVRFEDQDGDWRVVRR